jgi:DHA3 family macrolide efflux protein-like MFS transporter
MKMKTFKIICLGQLLSVLGSGLTGFALGVWVYQRTGSATQFTLVLFSGALPGVLLMPFAGLLADRWDRRLAMILSDAGAAVGVLALALMFYFNHVEIWLIYVILAFSSAFAVFQRPAFSAAISQLVAKEDLGRANGMVRTTQAVAQLFAPLLAGILLSFLPITKIFLIDLVSFGFAIITLMAVRFPGYAEEAGAEKPEAKTSWSHDIGQGWTYIAARSGLLSLMVFFAVLNFSGGLASALIQPLILSFTSASVLGTVMTLGGVGLLVGSIVMSVWGGPKRRVNGIFGFMPLAGLGIFMVGLQASVPLVTAAMFLAFFALPFIEGSTTAIVQSKVDPKVQGRVFAVTHVIAGCMAPLSYLLAGPLTDRVFEPLMAPGGRLAGTVGAVIGVGRGRGIALLFMVVGIALLLTTAIGYLIPRLRKVEDELPDMVPAPDTVPALPLAAEPLLEAT